MVFSQLMEFDPRHEFNTCVRRYGSDDRLRGFSCRDQFVCSISFGCGLQGCDLFIGVHLRLTHFWISPGLRVRLSESANRISQPSRRRVIDQPSSDKCRELPTRKGNFDTIPHDQLLKAVRKRVTDGSVLRMIEAWPTALVIEEVCASKK